MALNFGTTPHPQHPLAQILQAILFTSEVQKKQREEAALAAEARRVQQRAEALQQYHILQNQVQQYVAVGQQPPQQLLAGLDAVQRQFGLPGLPSQVTPTSVPTQGLGTQALQGTRVPGVTESVKSVGGERRFEFPTPRLAYETLGEMAQAFGYQLRPNVKPDLKIRDLMRQMPESAIMELFIRPEQQQEQVKAEAAARLQALGKYPVQQIFSPTFPQHLREQFQKDYQAVYGIPFPTQQVPTAVQVPMQRREEGGLSRFVAPTGTAQVQTGMETRPILPQTAPDFVVDIPKVGKVPFSQLPAGAQTAFINRIFESKEKVKVTLSDGTEVSVSPEKALELDLRKGSMVTFIDPVTKGKITVPSTSLPAFFPRKAPGGGGGGATETQARIKASLMQRYLAGQNLNEREQRVLFGATGEEIIPARDRKILELWRQNLDPLTNEPRDANLAARLKPDVDRIVNQMVTPPAQPTGGVSKSITMAELNEIARAEGKPIAAVVAAAKQQGYTITSEGAPARPAPRPTVTSDVSNMIRATAAALKRQGLNWTVARLRILRQLSSRGVNVGDPNVVRAVDQARY